MKALRLYKPYDLKMEEVRKPVIKPEEALVKVKAVGICGSDVHVYKGTYPEIFFPIIPGHEFSGEITGVGERVTRRLQLGDKVVAEPSISCGGCYFCKKGQNNLCNQPRRLGRTINGAFAEFVAVPAENVYKLQENISHEEAQSIVTLATVVRAIRRADIDIGDVVAILGPGHAGLLLLQVAKIVGAGNVIVTGTRENRLMLAEELGANITINVKKKDPAQEALDVTNGIGVDVVIDAAGTASSIHQSIEMVRAGGRVVVFGIPEKAVDNFDMTKVQHKELEMIGTRSGFGGYETAIKLVGENRVKIKPLITHIMPLKEIERGFEIVNKRLENVIRVVVTTE